MSVQLGRFVLLQGGLRQVRMESGGITGAVKTAVPGVFPGMSKITS